MKRICILCGQEFDAKSSRRLRCYKDHYHSCPICGIDVLTTDTDHQYSCCCLKHSRMLATKTIHERFPNAEHLNNPKTAALRRSKNTFCTVEGQAYAKQRVREIYGEDSVMRVPEIAQRVKDTCRKRYGADFWIQTELGKSTMQQRLKEKYGIPIKSTFELPEVKAKCDSTNLARYGTTLPMQNKSIWSKQRSNNRSRYIASDGTKLDSTYEVTVCEFCIRNKINFQTNIKLSYTHQGEPHVTYIDFQIDGILFEVKGEHILDGYFDDRGVPISTKLEVYRKNSVVVITGQTAANMFNDSTSAQPLKGVDIALFNPNKVPNSLSDGITRWSAILQHVKYYTGFIDAECIIQNDLNL